MLAQIAVGYDDGQLKQALQSENFHYVRQPLNIQGATYLFAFRATKSYSILSLNGRVAAYTYRQSFEKGAEPTEAAVMGSLRQKLGTELPSQHFQHYGTTWVFENTGRRVSASDKMQNGAEFDICTNEYGTSGPPGMSMRNEQNILDPNANQQSQVRGDLSRPMLIDYPSPCGLVVRIDYQTVLNSGTDPFLSSTSLGVYDTDVIGKSTRNAVAQRKAADEQQIRDHKKVASPF